MSFRFLNEGQRGNIQEFTPIDTFIDPVSKIRVSNPSNLIDTDFEYGLQPTKWETVELINNTPAFFSKSGDTTIADITGITTNSGTREVTVTTAFPHSLAVGIPIRVSGTKSVTADGSYIINATPTETTFTYLARANQEQTISIFDLYTSIITGEFFQGSQISISDAEGIVTNSSGPISTLTVKTPTKHGFGLNTPFYFLNLNSTISQEFESQNSASLSFDPSNSATAQNFDGSNTLLQTPIDLSNSATTSTSQSSITSTNPIAATVSVTISGEDWSVLKIGSPLYYSVSVGGGYFQQNPRGVVFIKNVNQINQSGGTATFQVSQIPDGPALPVLANMTGFFQIANQARTFAGNNFNPETQIDLDIQKEQTFLFDGGNRGYDGELASPPSNSATVVGYTGTTATVFTAEGSLDYYEGAMLRYSSTGAVASGLANNASYFVISFSPGASGGLFNMTLSELPGGSPITMSGGGGTQTFSKIGVSIDKNIVHVKNSFFEKDDMLEYSFPENGRFSADDETIFYFVETVFDQHNYRLKSELFTPTIATGGAVSETFSEGRLWRVHSFNNVGTSTFSVSSVGTEPILDYLVVAGGGGGGNQHSSGAGAGGYRTSVSGNLSGRNSQLEPKINLTARSYTVVVGGGGAGAGANSQGVYGQRGGNSSFDNITSIGGGGGGSWNGSTGIDRASGGSGGGGWSTTTNRGAGGAGTAGQGFDGAQGSLQTSNPHAGSGGGGAGAAGIEGNHGPNPRVAGSGGAGLASFITGYPVYRSGGGGGGVWYTANQTVPTLASGGIGGGGAGGLSYVGSTDTRNRNGLPNTGGGGGGSGAFEQPAGNGGSGTVIVRYPITPIIENPNSFMDATGGNRTTITQNGVSYAVHTFTATGSSTFTVNRLAEFSALNKVQYLIVAGGGGSGNVSRNGDAGGGGAGGFEGEITVSQGNYALVVGAGGAPTLSGGNSSISFGGSSLVTVFGGGRGGSQSGTTPLSGGSGGGGQGGGGSGTQGDVGAAGTVGQGHQGGRGWYQNALDGGGGGGGASESGQDTGTNKGGDGGRGRPSLITGTLQYYGGGGAGSSYSGIRALGGLGGGGRGGIGTGENGAAGAANTGGGGGAPAGAGGSGIIVIRYPIGAA